MKRTSIILLVVFLLLAVSALAQDTTQSLAFKNNKAARRTNLFYQPDLSYQIWKQFNLIKEANSGNASAQHELGIRYLLGDGMRADTVLGASWIKKAADQKLTAAAFNYGILLLNGWGVKWDPFLAFKNFLSAANDGMPQAQHLIGILYTDNLIVKRNWTDAYKWVKKASDSGYEPAMLTLKDIEKKIDVASLDTAKSTITHKSISGNNSNRQNGTSLTSSLGLVFIDFDSISDSTIKIENEDLLKDLILINNSELTNSLYINTSEGDSVLSMDSLNISSLISFAENGSPEALTLTGSFYEKGLQFKKDLITAAAYYIRAIRMDSPRAPVLLYELLKTNGFYNTLKERTNQNNPEAMFVWHGLYTLGLDNSITAMDAFNLLQKSAAISEGKSIPYLPAIVELGLSYYTGKIINEDKQKAFLLWKDAEKSGSKEASLRIETALIFTRDNAAENKRSFDVLYSAAENGSLMALVSLAYCYESGKGANKNYAEAVKNYRLAAQRGSRYAYNELQKIYDAYRPPEEIFVID